MFDGIIAQNNPILFSDPLGLWTFQLGASFSAGGGFGSTKGGGIILGRNSNTGEWQFGVYAVGGAGGQAGAGASLVADATFSTNDNITDVGGFATTLGGSGGVVVVGGGEVNVPMSGSARPSYTGSIGIGTPGGEGHAFGTYNYVKKLY